MPDRRKAYSDAGVNLDAADQVVSRIKKIANTALTRNVLSHIGSFGGLFKLDLENMKEPLLVAATDGVGTKIKLAVTFNKHDGIGVDLVAMSVNDILVQGATPLFFLDYFASGKMDVDQVEAVVASVARGCVESKCALLGGETAEMPGMYGDGEYDLAGFCVGMVDRANIIDGSGTRDGDAIIGLASSGVHSNGYSLVRKVVEESGIDPAKPLPFPEHFEPMSPGVPAMDLLMEPTVIYTKPVLNLLRDFEIKGMAHITGGGFYDNIPRILPNGVRAKIDFGLWLIPDVFHWLKNTAGLDWQEMLQVFNCGIGYILIVDKALAGEILERLNRAFQLKAWRIGEMLKAAPGSDPVVEINFDAIK